ncbi:hypothetical protein FJQ54_05180 [Sandaracinobacter neustonicus]|uniref:ATP-binding protein n=1 Tax=Sandaracinobacter neustonicus TaxID=1715348 RepID=A0A501XQS5_9SPHN|nr:ATP-binding protein [Sandaracinobacter neustonicus]TPE62584.1 hypothetical protein FJQ54_05180 [Sandaracinobacter neustonicus]
MLQLEPNQALAQPSKNFFVNMLVRDIELEDALLDLLDNCVDGILRTYDPDLQAAKPYEGYGANFVIGPELFQLDDNCGGIPIELARKKAFAIGRPDPITGTEGVATVGMYGIGMKRAIFKLGRDAKVRSWSDTPFEVSISEAWLANDDWDPLPLEEIAAGEISARGTRISVRKLNSQVKDRFADSAFINRLSQVVARHYALIIDKGFRITVRRLASDPVPDPILPKSFRLLASEHASYADDAIQPIVYKGHLKGVDIELYAGLFRRLPDADDDAKESEVKNSVDDAGWSVACNDRIVVWKDRTWVTGWGEGTTPSFHNQFMAITGLLILRSENPALLPLTTTKRGIDHGTEIYSYAKDMMSAATKKLTDFTNTWKKSEAALHTIYREDTVAMSLTDIKTRAPELPMKKWPRNKAIEFYIPQFPAPTRNNKLSTVSFVADKADVELLGVVYFADAKAKAKDVGRQAFAYELARYKDAAE